MRSLLARPAHWPLRTVVGLLIGLMLLAPGNRDLIWANGVGTVYVANEDSGTVSVIDPHAKITVEVINVGGTPHALALSSAGDFLYVVNNSTNSLNVIDTRLQAVIRNIQLPGVPEHIALAADGKRAYVTISSKAEVVEIDTETGDILKEIPVKGTPHDIAFSSDGSVLYFTIQNGQAVSSLDIATSQVETALLEHTRNTYLATPPTGSYFLVGDSSTDNLQVVDAGTREPLKALTVGMGAVNAVVAADNKSAFVAQERQNQVIAVNVETGQVTPFGATIADPWALAITPDGTELYVTSLADNVIHVLDTQSGVLRFTIGLEGQKGPGSIAMLPSAKPGGVAAGESSAPTLTFTRPRIPLPQSPQMQETSGGGFGNISMPSPQLLVLVPTAGIAIVAGLFIARRMKGKQRSARGPA